MSTQKKYANNRQRYFIRTFGCQQNVADSERVAAACEARGMLPAKDLSDATYIVINTCMVREKAENRVYGLVNNLASLKEEKAQRNNQELKIVVTGCMVGVAFRDKSGRYLKKIRSAMPAVDEFMPIEEVGFDHPPLRQDNRSASVPISNGCNNFCTFCVVPFTRGREISRPYEDIRAECAELKEHGYTHITLLGQNVNSYGADLLLGEDNIQVMRDIDKTYFDEHRFKENEKKTSVLSPQLAGRKPVYVSHLGRHRIPTLFPFLLEEVAQMGFEHLDFMSSNPWDFSDELIEVIAGYANITRTIHLPVQSGDNALLRRMNRWYTRDEYLNLVKKIRTQVPEVRFTTDIIVGFCGETEEQFENTVDLCKKVGYNKAYISMYSERPMTAATKVMQDDIPHPVKKKRWQTLDRLINYHQHYDATESRIHH